jgi:signal transduction histidine kinase
LSNAIKHSNAEEIRVSLCDEDDVFHVEVIDDGIGFSEVKLSDNEKHFGIKILEERVQLLKGQLMIFSPEGNKTGTIIRIEIPTTAM